MIPKIIHIIWVGDESKRPDNCIETWRQHNIGWQFKIWGNADLAAGNWINWRHMGEISKYELNGLADLMRWEILYNEGGVVVDADSVCVRSLDDHLLECDAFACWENEIVRPGLIAAGYVGAHSGNEFIGQIINDIFSEMSVTNEMAWKTVGPQRLTDSYRKYNYQSLKIYPSHYFIPKHFTGIKYNGDGPIYAHQEWASTNNSYDKLHLKDVSDLNLSIRANPTNNLYHPVPTSKERSPPKNPQTASLYSENVKHRVKVSANLIQVSRLEVFSKLCAGQRVLHIGSRLFQSYDASAPLHIALGPICRRLDGFDVEKETLPVLKNGTAGILYSDLLEVRDEYDVVLALEVLAFTTNPAEFLSQLNLLNTRSIVFTVPDLYKGYSSNFEYIEDTSEFIELAHPDHAHWYTPYTLSKIISKYTNWAIEDIWFLDGNSLMVLVSK